VLAGEWLEDLLLVLHGLAPIEKLDAGPWKYGCSKPSTANNGDVERQFDRGRHLFKIPRSAL